MAETVPPGRIGDRWACAPATGTAPQNENPEAGRFFVSLAPSYRRQYIGWVTGAKREETRKRRLAEALQLLEAGKKLPLK